MQRRGQTGLRISRLGGRCQNLREPLSGSYLKRVRQQQQAESALGCLWAVRRVLRVHLRAMLVKRRGSGAPLPGRREGTDIRVALHIDG